MTTFFTIPFGAFSSVVLFIQSNPRLFSAREDEQVAAALGYTVHLLLLASKYLEVRSQSSSAQNACDVLISLNACVVSSLRHVPSR